MKRIVVAVRSVWDQVLSKPLSTKLLLLSVAGIATCWVYFLFTYLWCFVMVQRHLQSQKWDMPATIYARPQILKPNSDWTQSKLKDNLEALFYHRQSIDAPVIKGGEYKQSGNEIIFRKRPLFLNQNPPPIVHVEFASSGIRSIRYEGSDRELQQYELEPEAVLSLFGTQWEKRTLVSYKDFPAHLIHAVIAIEDRRFFSHHGIDIRAIFRALFRNLSEKQMIEGGSTITQQVAKNFYLSPERSIRRKITELILAGMLETRLTKQEILELYLNEIYLGQRGSVSINGIGEAARVYFRKDAQHLTVPEAALLAGMIRAPNLYHPKRHPKEAKERRDVVLQVMQELGFLTQQEYKKYQSSPVEVNFPEPTINLAPYYGDLVKTQLLQEYDEDAIYKSDLHVFTSLDLQLQDSAEKALIAGLNEIDRKRYSKVKTKVQGCLIAVDPSTGKIRALVGGREYASSQFNRVTNAFRQPGSIFKPVVYAAALQQTKLHQQKTYTPATLISDEPWILRDGDETWEPANYDGQFHGLVTLRTALARSMNVATVRLGAEIGWERVADLAKQMGFENAESIPSIALGSLEASPWQVATAYTVFANGGMRSALQTIDQVSDSTGKILHQGMASHDRILQPQVAFLITSMLGSALFNGTGSSIQKFGFYRPAAGKTGTTDEYRDAWFAGYTPNLLCVVWVGYDDNVEIGMSGAEAALPIWARFMVSATRNEPLQDFAVPDDLVTVMIDPETGNLASSFCPQVQPEVFVRGTEPRQICSNHDMGVRASLFTSTGPPVWREHFRSRGRSTGGFWGKFKRKFRRIF